MRRLGRIWYVPGVAFLLMLLFAIWALVSGLADGDCLQANINGAEGCKEAMRGLE